MAIGACGDDGDEQARGFCDEAVPVLAAFWSIDVDPSDNQFAEVVEAMEEVDPPSTIDDEWERVVAALVVVRDQDAGDPAAVAEAQEGVLALREDVQTIERYVNTTCGAQ